LAGALAGRACTGWAGGVVGCVVCCTGWAGGVVCAGSAMDGLQKGGEV
jgi:hypothetical protein